VPKEEKELETMQKVAFAMVDEELNRLYAFVSASSKIEKRKLDITRSMRDALKNVATLTPQLQGLQSQIEKQDALQKKASYELARLKSPPILAPVESYFSTPDVSPQVRSKYSGASQSLIDSINGFHKDLKDQLSFSKEDSAKLNVIKNTLFKLTQYQRSIQGEITKHETDLRNMGPTWKNKAEREALRDNLRDVSLKAVAEELNRLTDYQSAFEYAKKSKDEMTRLIQAREQELARINGDISRLRKEAQTMQGQIDAYDDILNVTEERQLSLYVPDPTKPVTVKDIAQLQVEEYKASLADLDHYQLLELVVQRFKSKPDRYPKWLQYMVIHFSGMRYASAHGSWADPKDLLANLETAFIGKDLKKMDDAAVEAFCREELECYEPSMAPSTTPARRKPDLAQTTDPEWKERIAQHVKRLTRALEIDSTSYQRSALLNLRIDEENYRIDRLKPTEVTEGLLSYKDELPEWMWKEIVKLTDLRVNQVTDPNWEKLTPAQQAGQYSDRMHSSARSMNGNRSSSPVAEV
jgi:prefoldin subunit 5